MKRTFFYLATLYATIGMYAQEDFSSLIKIRDPLIISEPSSSSYKFIDVPRKNFIIKRGGIANIGSLHNVNVTVTKIRKGDKPRITFKKSDNRKFFKAYRTLKADLNGAIKSGELKIPTKSKKDSLAK